MKIINDIMQTRPNYCHVLEVDDIFELQQTIQNILEDFIPKYSVDDIKYFFDTIQIYALNDENEDAIYDFNVEAYVINFLDYKNDTTLWE